MTDQLLDPRRTVVLVMDFQTNIVDGVALDPRGVVERAARALAGARQAELPIIYLVHRGGRYGVEGTAAEICPGVAPEPGERVITKFRAGSFSTTGLDALLREERRDTLVLLGVATSGCVLSTARWGAELRYQLIVLADACDDRDAEVHRVLTEKVFPRQATVVSVDEFLRQLPSGNPAS
jgi:nicotinamidase-related amidase